jgi:hypothetical protein
MRRAVSSAFACFGVGKRQSAARRPAVRSLLDVRTNEEQDRSLVNPGILAMAEPVEQQPVVDEAAELEAAVGQAIEACGGDPVDAVRALVIANAMLERELAERLREDEPRIPARAAGRQVRREYHGRGRGAHSGISTTRSGMKPAFWD